MSPWSVNNSMGKKYARHDQTMHKVLPIPSFPSKRWIFAATVVIVLGGGKIGRSPATMATTSPGAEMVVEISRRGLVPLDVRACGCMLSRARDSCLAVG